MRYYQKMLVRCLLIFSLFQGMLNAIEIESLNHAVDVAGKQRMFTQRMLKDYAMIGMENSFGNPREDLNKTMIAFEDHLEALSGYTQNTDIQKSAKEVKTLWKPIKKVLGKTPQKSLITQLQNDLEALLKESNHLTGLFAKATGEQSGEIINISGRQRMLSQRMAGLYMIKAWGIEDKNFEKKMRDAMTLFKTSLERLKASKLNNDEINTLLSKVEKSFMFFEVMGASKTTFIPTLIYKKSNDILKNMNTATHLYVVVSKK